MAQVRRVRASAVDKGRIRVSVDATIAVEPGVLTKDEVNRMRRGLADRLMLLLANDVSYLHVHLSDIKVTR
jgi:hypothetical protein